MYKFIAGRIETIEDGAIIMHSTERTGDDEHEGFVGRLCKGCGYLLEEDAGGDLVAWRFTAEEDAETEEVAR